MVLSRASNCNQCKVNRVNLKKEVLTKEIGRPVNGEEVGEEVGDDQLEVEHDEGPARGEQ